MKAFEFVDARSAREAAGLLAKHGRKAALFASGADLLYMLKDSIAGPAVPSPDVLINLEPAGDLAGIRVDPVKGLSLGAMTRLVELVEHPQIRSQYPLIAEAASKIASPQLRNTSTLAGNLCQRPRCWYFRHPDIVCLKKGGDQCWAVEGDNRFYHAILEGGPCHIVHPSDLAPALIALDATIHMLGPKGPRSIPLDEFFVTTAENLHQENVLSRSEVVTGLTVPRPHPGTRQVFLKSTIRQAGEFALAAVAVAAQVKDGVCSGCRVVLGGVSPRPYRAVAAEQAILGKRLTPENISEAGEAGLKGAAPMSMNAYKVDLAAGLIARALETAAGGAG